MTTLLITSSDEKRTFLLEENRHTVASLHISRAAGTNGEIQASDSVWPLARHARNWWQIAVGDPADPILELRRGEASVPGGAEPFAWEIRGRFARFHAVLGGLQQTIVLECSGVRAPHADVEVTGSWAHRDMTVLACFFATMARRSRSIILLSS